MAATVEAVKIPEMLNKPLPGEPRGEKARSNSAPARSRGQRSLEVAQPLQDAADAIERTLARDYGVAAAEIKAENAALYDDFAQLHDGLVGRSIIPDTVKGIGTWFGKLDGVMVLPAAQATDKIETAFRTMGASVAGSIGNMVQGGKFDLDSLRQTAARLAGDLRNMIVDRAITAPINRLFSGVLDGIFGGTRAHGGPVSPGKAFLVGEEGPELFMPSAPGRIAPDGGFGAAGGMDKGAIQVTNKIMIDARGADPAQLRRVEHAVHTLVKATPSMAVAAVMRHMARNPGY